jgi:hypothetical protein
MMMQNKRLIRAHKAFIIPSTAKPPFYVKLVWKTNKYDHIMVPLVLSHYQYGECGGLNASANCASKHLMRASTNAIAVAVLLIYTTKI